MCNVMCDILHILHTFKVLQGRVTFRSHQMAIHENNELHTIKFVMSVLTLTLLATIVAAAPTTSTLLNSPLDSDVGQLG